MKPERWGAARWMLAASLGAAAAGWMVLRLTPLPEALSLPPPATEVTARDGTLLYTRLSPKGQRALPAGPAAQHLVDATLAGEDHRFAWHPGVDPVAVARALWLNVQRQRFAFGGSTLTQQLVRLCMPAPRTLGSKLRESFWALVLERQRTKQDILRLYLARAPYGGSLVGAEAAAQFYFGVPSGRLSLAQASLLAVIPRAPLRYDPRTSLSAALQRRHHVLGLMVTRGTITAEQAAAAEAEVLDLHAVPPPMRASHAVWRVLSATPVGTPRVTTTLDAELQERAEVLVRRTVEELSDRGVSQAAALVVELPGGEVRAYVGSAGKDERHGQVDALISHRSPGSALKPLIYARALADGLTASTVLMDVERAFNTADGAYLPHNFDLREHGPVRLRTALASSFNLSAVEVAQRLGERVAWDTLLSFGLHPVQRRPGEVGLGVVLGGIDVTPWDVAGAYLTLATGGRRRVPTLLSGEAAAPGGSVVSSEVAWLITNILADDEARAPAFGRHSALHLPFDAAVKTGTSKDFRDNWAVGFSTRWLVLTWAGDFEARSMRGVSGITGAGTLWHRLMRQLHADADPPPFPRVQGVRAERICALSGAVAGPHCPHTVSEWFASGTAPEPACTFHTPNGQTVYPASVAGWARRAHVDAAAGSAAAVTFPKADDVFHLDPRKEPSQRGITVLASGPAGVPLEVWMDGALVGRGSGSVSVPVVAKAGRHTLEARAGGASSEPVVFEFR